MYSYCVYVFIYFRHQVLLHKKKDSRAFILSGSQQVTSRQSSARSSMKSGPYGSKSYLKQSNKSLDKHSVADSAFAQQVRPLINNNQTTDLGDIRSTHTDSQMNRSLEDFSAASTPPYFTTTTMNSGDAIGRTVLDYTAHPTGGCPSKELGQSRVDHHVMPLPVYFELDPNSTRQSDYNSSITHIDGACHEYLS